MLPTLSHPATLPLRRIVQGNNPREYFDPDEMAELEEGLRAADGVVQPIIVRPIPGSDLYEIVVGERRWRAAKNVFGDDYDMPVVVRALNDAAAEAFAVIENHYRAAMSHAEEAKAAQRQLLRHKGNKEEAAARLGWKPELLERRLALLTCTQAVLSALTRRQIQLGHAELLAGVPPDKQDSVLAAIVERQVPVAVLKAQLGRFARRLADAIFDTAQCANCQHNSARQSGLFDESLGDGFCQHPTHYDELTLQAVQAKADGLRDHYPVVRIVKASDGFTPLPVAEDGALGVGPQQYGACKGCASFGCAVSALPGSYGEVTASLCFDGTCNSQMVAAWHKVRVEGQRQGSAKPAGSGGKGIGKSTPHRLGKASSKAAPQPTNHTPQRVVEHRIAQWRKWAAKDLMVQPERNRRVMIALARSGHAGDVRMAEFGQAARRISGPWVVEGRDFGRILPDADAIDTQHLDRLMLAVTASAAFGLNLQDLEALLNYLDVDERRHFTWDSQFLELFTMSELEALAGEVGLRARMGSGFKVARGKKKSEFIAALLKVPGFTYEGTVPAVMCYPRRQPSAKPGVEEGAEAQEPHGPAGQETDVGPPHAEATEHTALAA
ncbi:PRTRC system ParB family protein [Methylibium sp.]|uniref:PRTRC system ParB family protein n=1 Tax=Methylibium sp. TaxID=2067992 RepID=UPI003D0D8DA9